MQMRGGDNDGVPATERLTDQLTDDRSNLACPCSLSCSPFCQRNERITDPVGAAVRVTAVYYSRGYVALRRGSAKSAWTITIGMVTAIKR
jgi:hypothetical protein